jgi:hypothetical protein
MVVGLVHVALVAPHYFVGSFDDDSGYLLAARALLSGHGLTAHLANGMTVAGSFPPGYSALLVPLLWIWPHTFAPERVLSVVCYAGVFPLTWIYLGRRRMSEGLRFAVLVLLALGPAFATFGSMVMAETPFLVLFLLFLPVLDRWGGEAKTWTWSAAGTVLLAGALIWCKEAAVGMVAGAVIWLLLRRGHPVRLRSPAKAGVLLAGTFLLLAPVALARVAGGLPLAGSRYSMELGAYYHGSLMSRLVHVTPDALWHFLSTALPATIVPYLAPLPLEGHAPDLWKALSWQVTILALIGAIVWTRRVRDSAVVVVGVYLAETLMWPYVNERRVILALPVIAAWYVLGAVETWKWLCRQVTARRPVRRPAALAAAGIATFGVLAVVVAPLVAQSPRDYLFGWGQDSSRIQGSRYASILSRLGSPADVVETDYLSSTALFTGHRTASTAFVDTLAACYVPGALAAIAHDHAGYLLVGNLNKPGRSDSPCLAGATAAGNWAVELLHTTRDNASVFELLGPGTGHPGLRDLTGQAAMTTRSTGQVATVDWQWDRPQPVTQVSAGAASAGDRTQSVLLQLHLAGGGWRTVASSSGPVGDGAGATPYLLSRLPVPVAATGARLVLTAAPGSVVTPSTSDVVAIGGRPGS